MISGNSAGKTRRLPIRDFEVEATRKPVRRVNLRVRRDGSVAVSAPSRMPWAEIERFVRDHAEWIERHRSEALVRHPARRWEEGELVRLWGTPLSVNVISDASEHDARAECADNVIRLHVESKHAICDTHETQRRSLLFDALLADEMRQALSTLLPSCEQRVGRKAGDIRLRRMTSRWGSCNVGTGRITLNLELAEHPRQCLEAVLCHELCHLHERGHNGRFYALLDQACPDWRVAHELLRRPAENPRVGRPR